MYKSLIIGMFLLAGISEAKPFDIYISKIAKTEMQSRFLHRFARNDAHVVITNEALPYAKKSIKFSIDDEKKYFIMDHFPKLAHDHASLDFEGVSIYEGEIPHDVDHHGMITLNLETTIAPKAVKRQYEVVQNFTTPAIDEFFLEEMLYKLSGEIDFESAGIATRIPERGSESAKESARNFLISAYRDLGYDTELHAFGGFWNKGVNVIAKKTISKNAPTVILSSHYDSMNNKGADDNGAGTIANLVIAKALKNVDLDFNVLFVAFDLEEKGLLGSKAYVKELQKTGKLQNIAAVINIEMLGYDSDNDGAIHVIHCNENSSKRLYDAYWKSTKQAKLKLVDVEACTNRSDHAPFWQKNIPAIVLSQNFFGGDGNPCYHKKCDDVSIINWNYINANTQAILNLVTSLKI